jgi:hypothetical protein
MRWEPFYESKKKGAVLGSLIHLKHLAGIVKRVQGSRIQVFW